MKNLLIPLILLLTLRGCYGFYEDIKWKIYIKENGELRNVK